MLLRNGGAGAIGHAISGFPSSVRSHSCYHSPTSECAGIPGRTNTRPHPHPAARTLARTPTRPDEHPAAPTPGRTRTRPYPTWPHPTHPHPLICRTKPLATRYDKKRQTSLNSVRRDGEGGQSACTNCASAR